MIPDHLTTSELLHRWRTELPLAGLDATDPGPASEDEILSLERRIGRPLPPSYRDFLRISNGMPGVGGFITALRRAERVGWFRDEEREWYEIWLNIGDPEDPLPDVQLMARALLISDRGDQVLLLDPDQVDPETGEWACFTFSNWAPGATPAGNTFRTGLDEVYRDFLANEEIESETLVEIEDRVEALYRSMLVGNLHARDELTGYLRTSWRAWLLATQFDAFNRTWGDFSKSGNQLWRGRHENAALTDPVVLADVIPLYVVRMVETGQNLGYQIGGAPAVAAHRMQTLADDIERGIGPVDDFSYSPEFATAVDEARRRISAGQLDAAWNIIENALPSWTPMSPNHLVPTGLYWDKDLRRLFDQPPPDPRLKTMPTGEGLISTSARAGYTARPAAPQSTSTASIVANRYRPLNTARLNAVLETAYQSSS